MKKTKFLVLAVLAAMFVGCQSEEPEQISGNDRPGPTGDTRIIIEGEGMLDTQSRSSDGRVDFTGGYATGAGLYDRTAAPTVAAHPDAGYEVSYFYGGPASEPKKYDYAQSQSSTFRVPLGGQDHTFHCEFKEKKRTLTVNAGSGGKVTPSGTKEYQVEKPINITATPNSGYEFSGWSITGGDVTIANSNSSSTTATLHNSNSTITAKFTTTTPFCYLLLCDEQYDTREMQDRAIIYYRDLGEIPDKENTYSRVQYSVYEWEYDLKIEMIGTNEFLGWYDSSYNLIESAEDLRIEDILRNYPEGSTIYAKIKPAKAEAPSSVSVKITSSGTGYNVLYSNQFPSSWPRYDKAEVVQYKLVSSWGASGTLKLYYSNDNSTYCTITGANSYYPIFWYRDEERSTATITHWEWTVGTETTYGNCSSIHEVKGELEYNGIQYSISY